MPRKKASKSGRRASGTTAAASRNPPAGTKEIALALAFDEHERARKEAQRRKIARQVAALVSARVAIADRPRKKKAAVNLLKPFALRPLAPGRGPKVKPLRVKPQKKTCDRRKKERRSVLLAAGKVNKPGGAPGKNGEYKKRKPC